MSDQLFEYVDTVEEAEEAPADFFEDRPIPETLREAILESVWIIDRAKREYGPIKRIFLMVSGGNDSMVLLDCCDWAADEVVHINTGIGIPETNEFVRKVVAERYLGPFTELHPPVPYEELILDDKLFGGFPGPGAHHFIYTRLKERSLESLLRERRTKRGERFMLLTGIRNDESKRRMGYSSPIDRKGGQVWVNPLIRWSNDLMREYRETQELPVNEVTKHLHMSGECLCGAFARPGELDEIAFFYPAFADRIRNLEAQVEAKGLPAARWGVRPPKKPKPIVVNNPDGSVSTFQPSQIAAGPMCTSCTLWIDEDA